MNNLQNKEIQYKVLSPLEFSGSSSGDYGYEIENVKSIKSYVSESGARKAMNKELTKRA